MAKKILLGLTTIAEGGEWKNKVKEIVEIIKKGPPVSRVDEVEIIWQDAKEIFDGFKIIK